MAQNHLDTHRLEASVLRMIQLGRGRCGLGFGKYPLGVLDAIDELVPLVIDSPHIQARLDDFKQRLEQ